MAIIIEKTMVDYTGKESIRDLFDRRFFPKFGYNPEGTVRAKIRQMREEGEASKNCLYEFYHKIKMRNGNGGNQDENK